MMIMMINLTCLNGVLTTSVRFRPSTAKTNIEQRLCTTKNWEPLLGGGGYFILSQISHLVVSIKTIPVTHNLTNALPYSWLASTKQKKVKAFQRSIVYGHTSRGQISPSKIKILKKYLTRWIMLHLLSTISIVPERHKCLASSNKICKCFNCLSCSTNVKRTVSGTSKQE